MPSDIEHPARIVVLMGVAGCGKTSVGAALGALEGRPFLDGDDYHPAANVEKMRTGTPLTDEDRWPWLDTLGQALSAHAEIDGQVFAACSALKRSYRERLRVAAREPLLFLHLDGSRDVIGARMAARKGHYMPPALLDSQFDTLEPLGADEAAHRIGIDGSLEEIVATCRQVIAAK